MLTKNQLNLSKTAKGLDEKIEEKRFENMFFFKVAITDSPASSLLLIGHRYRS